MTTVSDVLSYMENDLAPRSMKEDWDNVGLNCGHLGAPVTKILVALDPFFHVCQEARDMGAQLLVTHHVLLFHPGFITDGDSQGRNALFLMEHGIAHINAHTNLDVAPGGVNDCLALRLGLEDIQVIDPSGRDDQGRPWGLLRSGTAQQQSLPEFLERVKRRLGCPGLRYVDGGKPVRKVAVGGGSCSEFMAEAARAGCDTFVTADVKYNGFWDAQSLGLNLIDAGHFYTENPVIPVLAQRLADRFPDVEVCISKTHRDCALFF